MSANGRFIGRSLQVGGGLILALFAARAVYSVTGMSPEANLGAHVLVAVLSSLPGLVLGGLLWWAGAATVRRNRPPE